MKKVRENLNETDMFMKDMAYKSYQRIHRKVTVHCQQVIDTCGKVLDKYEEEGAQDEADEYSIANNEGRIEVAQEILEMLRNL